MSFGDMTDRGAGRVDTEDFTRSVHALFDDRAAAEKAHQDLVAAGIPDHSITVEAPAPADESAAEPLPDPGFWDRIVSLFIPDDQHSFAEGVRRGGVAIVVRTDTANYDRVIDILDRDGAVDLDERQESWRQDGWTGYTGADPLADARSPSLSLASAEEEPRYTPPSAATAGFGVSGADHFPLPEDAAPRIDSPGAVPADMLDSTPDVQYAAAAPGVRDLGGEDVPRGWTRDTAHGRTRVRTYTADGVTPRRDLSDPAA